jgi:ubiquinone biosynthesis protein
MPSFLETPGDIKRFLEIMKVFLKYGWESAFELQKRKEKFPFLTRLEKQGTKRDDIPGPVKLRKIFEELGPTFIKFGQMLSTRPDLVKEEYIVELRKLQDEAPAFDFIEAKHILKKELGRPLDSVFKEFEKTPVAAASLGQVHLAKLKNGREVAVKIQRPDIEHVIAEDLRIIGFIAGLVEKSIKSTQYYNPTSIAAEFAETIRKELDYNREAKNAERFAHNFRNEEGVAIPKVYKQFTTKRLLVLEKVDGRKISRFYKNKSAALKKAIAKAYIRCFFKQMLIHGFFQADPHPANIFVSIRKGKPVISLVDFGMVGRLDRELRDSFATTMVLLVDRNVKGLYKHFQAMKLLGHVKDEKQLLNDMSEIIDYFYDMEFSRVDLAGFGNAFISLMVKHQVKVPRHYLLFLRSISIAQDTVLKLYPDINLVEEARPYIEKIVMEKTRPEYMLRSFRDNYFEFSRFLRELPESVMNIFKKMEEENFKVQLEAETLDNLGHSLNKSSNTLSISIIIAAMIMGSSLLLSSKLETSIGSTVDIGTLGFIISGIIGLLIAVRILNA